MDRHTFYIIYGGNAMKITWLGQAGFLFEKKDLTIMIDPYLSESCLKINPRCYRRFPVDESFFSVKPDVVILTHSHLDHTDPETLDHYLKGTKGVTVLAAENAWEMVRSYGRDHEYVLFSPGTEFTMRGVTFKSVYACHSDTKAIGVLICDEGTTYYVTGDTLYNEKVFESVREKVDAVFLPINGVGNNMNPVDARRFADRIGARKVVPCHFGLHDEIDAKEVIAGDDLVIPIPFREVIL